MQVLYLILCGRPLRDVAGILKITQQTAGRHHRGICEKFHARNGAELLRMAFLDGWIGQRAGIADAGARQTPGARAPARHIVALRGSEAAMRL